MKRKKVESEETMTDAVAVVLDRAIGVDHGRAVLAVQVATAKPFFAAAGEDAGRSVCVRGRF